MRAMITAAGAAAVLLTATSVLAMTRESPSPAGMKGAQFLNGQAHLVGSFSDLQARMVGGGLRTDGLEAFSGDGASSYGYLLSAEPADSAKAGAERAFEDELPTPRAAPGTTVYYAKTPSTQAVAPQAK